MRPYKATIPRSYFRPSCRSPQTDILPTPLFRLEPQLSPPVDPPTRILPTRIQPLLQILTLAHVETLEFRAPLDHSFDACARNPDAASNR